MGNLSTINDLDITKLSKSKLLDFFSLLVSQEEPYVRAEKGVKWFEDSYKMTQNINSPKDIDSLDLRGKTKEELNQTKDHIIKEDLSKLNDINQRIKKYLENTSIQEEEYKEHRNKLTSKETAEIFGFENTKDFEKVLGYNDGYENWDHYKRPKIITFLFVVIAFGIGFYLYHRPPFKIMDVAGIHEFFAFFLVCICSILSFCIMLRILDVFMKKIKYSQTNNIEKFMSNCIPLDLSKVSYGIHNGKPSYLFRLGSRSANYPNSLAYSVSVDKDEYNKDLKRVKSLEDHISSWKDNGYSFLCWVQKLQEEQYKYHLEKQANTRLSLAIPIAFSKGTIQGCIDTSLIFSSLLSSGRADTWKEAANLSIEDSYKKSMLRELGQTRQFIVDNMIKTSQSIIDSISNEAFELSNSITQNIAFEGYKNQLVLNDVNRSLDRLQLINGALLIDTLLK